CAWGVLAGASALPAYLGGPLSFPELRGPWVAVEALAILAGILILLYAGNTLTPALNAARDAGPAAHGRLARLHRRWVGLQGVVLVLGVGLLTAFAVRPATRTSGLEEMTPVERQRYDERILQVIDDLEAGRGARPESGKPAGRDRFPIDAATIDEIDD